MRTDGFLPPCVASLFRRAAFALVPALVIALGSTLAPAPARAADVPGFDNPPDPAIRGEHWRAGETQRVAKSQSAAARNHGDDTLRLVVWYPAPSSAREAPIVIGDAAHPLFIAGRAAPQAAWADGSRRPLVMLSHGFGGVGGQLAWLGTALARHGYVAVAVDHPGTNGRDGITAEGAYAPWERAGDIAAALDLVLADAVIGARVDASRIGMAGFSLGGWTGALLAGARTDFARLDAFCNSKERDSICDPQVEYPLDFSLRGKALQALSMQPIAAREHADLHDPRIKAAFLIAPALGEATDPESLGRVQVPVAIVAGAADTIVVPATNAEIFHGIPHSQLVILPRVGHYDFLSECAAEGRKASAAYCSDGKGTQRAETHAATVHVALEFFDATLGAPAAPQASR